MLRNTAHRTVRTVPHGTVRAQAALQLRPRAPFTAPIRFASSASTPRSSGLLVNGILAVGLLGVAGVAYYYEATSSTAGTQSEAAGSAGSPGGETFDITIGGGRRRQTHTFTRLSDGACEAKLREHELSRTVNRPGNPVVRWDRNWVGSNEPCEDRSAVDLIPRSRSARDISWSDWIFPRSPEPIAPAADSSGSKDLVLFSIIDGHAGWATSELLSKVLHPTLTLHLAALQTGSDLGSGGWLGSFKKLNPLSWTTGLSWTPANVMQTISSAYTQLDDNIVYTPARLIPTLSSPPQPGQPTARQTLAALAVPADNGACAISAVVDAEEGDLYVALAGDCRAVAGWEKDGVWRCDVLSEDQMGENEREIQRMRREHPGEEDTVILRGRVQGGLQPTRAFGDASYKWTHEQAKHICDSLEAEGSKARRPRPYSKTPPYVTARPEMTHRKIAGQDGEKLRFVVLATDGLWDRLTSEEATLLLASYLAHPTHPEIHKSSLPRQFPLKPYPPGFERPYPAQDLPGTGSPERSTGTWAFEGDSNAATHLIRNSLGGGDKKERGELLSMNGPVTRWLRDDVTVTVVFFDDPAKPASL